MKILSGGGLLVAGVFVAAICALLQFQAGIGADLNQTEGALSPVVPLGILVGLIAAAAGAVVLYQSYEHWQTALAVHLHSRASRRHPDVGDGRPPR